MGTSLPDEAPPRPMQQCPYTCYWTARLTPRDLPWIGGSYGTIDGCALWLLSGQLHREGVGRHWRGLEHDLLVADVDDDRLPGLELLPQELLRQRVLDQARSEEHTSELQSRENLVCRLLL